MQFELQMSAHFITWPLNVRLSHKLQNVSTVLHVPLTVSLSHGLTVHAYIEFNLDQCAKNGLPCTDFTQFINV
jgi:hypothetical protein